VDLGIHRRRDGEAGRDVIGGVRDIDGPRRGIRRRYAGTEEEGVNATRLGGRVEQRRERDLDERRPVIRDARYGIGADLMDDDDENATWRADRIVRLCAVARTDDEDTFGIEGNGHQTPARTRRYQVPAESDGRSALACLTTLPL